MRRSSNITTNATGTATGGNITIDTGVIAASENSDITANADEASGGQVIIDAQGIFGTEFRERENPATSDTVWTDLRPLTQQAQNLPISEEATKPSNPTTGQLVEATGWVINDKGEVVLTATAPTATPHIPWLTPASCHTPEPSS